MNSTLEKIVAKAKQLKKQAPSKFAKWTDYVKQASKDLKPVIKKAKKTAKKITKKAKKTYKKHFGYSDDRLAVLKKTTPKIKKLINSGYSRKQAIKKAGIGQNHTDKNSHNVKLSIYSGSKKITNVPDPYDKDAVYEIKLFIENDGNLYRRQTAPILKNLTKKYKKGTFDINKASKAFRPLIDSALKMYTFEHGSKKDKWSDLLVTTDRQYLAEWLASDLLSELELGNFYD